MNKLINKLRQEPDRALIVLICFGALCCAIFLIAYLIKFASNGYSDDPDNWGVFGDYVGGTLNPIFSFISMCVTIWIAIMVNRFTDKNSEREIEAQRQISLMHLRHESIKEFRIELEKRYEEWTKDPLNLKKAESYDDLVTDFFLNYSFLFDTKSNEYAFDIGHEILSFRQALLKHNSKEAEQVFNGIFSMQLNLFSLLRKTIVVK